MNKFAWIIVSLLSLFLCMGVSAAVAGSAGSTPATAATAVPATRNPENNTTIRRASLILSAKPAAAIASATDHTPSLPHRDAIPWLFLKSFLLGVLAVFTPYVYTIHPFTTGYLYRNVTGWRRALNALVYALSLFLIFTLLGALIAGLIRLTGVQKFADHWIFNLFFFRIFLTLGISFLGAFSIKLPASFINAIANNAQTNNYRGIFFMAVTLPGASFSSTFPIVGLVLLFAGSVPVIGPVIGLSGFALGLATPFILPSIITIFVRSTSMLNNIKVLLGFFSLMIALKFMSKADISLGLHLIDRDLFVTIWMGIWAIMALYMLGLLKLSHDTESEGNHYGIDYVQLPRLFIAIGACVFVLYLLPGLWGAPLHLVSNFLP